MSKTKCLIDTNILIYHVAGSKESMDFINKVIKEKSFNISVITKNSFLDGTNIPLMALRNVNSLLMLRTYTI
jgi:hypothetical protein